MRPGVFLRVAVGADSYKSLTFPGGNDKIGAGFKKEFSYGLYAYDFGGGPDCGG
jgi:hypothetical protein